MFTFFDPLATNLQATYLELKELDTPEIVATRCSKDKRKNGEPAFYAHTRPTMRMCEHIFKSTQSSQSTQQEQLITNHKIIRTHYVSIDYKVSTICSHANQYAINTQSIRNQYAINVRSM